jgi:hypothetical protein
VEYTIAEYNGDSGFIPTAGSISTASAVPSSYVTYQADVTYTISITPEHDVPTSGYIMITFPSTDFIMKDTTVTSGCQFDGENPQGCESSESDATITLEL